MTQTQTVYTKYGEVDIETVECDSCGDTIGKEQAYQFAISQNGANQIQHTHRNGWVCEHCAEESPASFPPDEYVFETSDNSVFWGVVLWPLIVILGGPQITNDGGKARDYMIGALGAITWVALPLLINTVVGLVL